ncbi:MAG: class I SAM-dependent methyltransferase [Candidatus Wallbacteria bacterium]|nr:class I SAM-dependent methyltransferase [Candidatus Wallbacteria bacterium]
MKLQKLLADPIGVLKRRIRLLFQRLKYRSGRDYRSKDYWDERHKTHGLELTGVGDAGLSTEENLKDYETAGKTLALLLDQCSLDYSRISILDIGCGNGYYAQLLKSKGAANYRGIDISDVLFPELRAKSGFRFDRLDIGSDSLEDIYDLVLMIDVTQHIVFDDKFSFAMRNVREHLKPGGSFVVTSFLSEKKRHSFYEVSRPFELYWKEFPGFHFSNPLPFRDKFIFLIRK